MLLTNLTILPMDGPADDPTEDLTGRIGTGSIRVDGDRIAARGSVAPLQGELQVDCAGLVALPGFVQGHVHYCQTLFRGLADDLPLIDWLQTRIWPLEAAHDAASTRISAQLSVAELLLGGTTTTQVMESVRYAEESFAVAEASGMTTILGNCLMDIRDAAVPPQLPTTGTEAMRMVEQLHREFHGRDNRLFYAVSPRFILSCSNDLAEQAAGYATEHALRIHTHACEHPDEIQLVRERTGRDYILALEAQGLLTQATSLAHCVHTTSAERATMIEHGTAVLHCPSTNLKLGSGLAPVAEYRKHGLRVALGADGAPCNNRLSMLTEMRQAALIQSVVAGPGAWPAAQVLHTATAGGAAALGLQDEVGSLTVGKRADIVLMDLGGEPLIPGGDLTSRIVYAAESAHIRDVMVGGTWRVRHGRLVHHDPADLAGQAQAQLDALLTRAGLRR